MNPSNGIALFTDGSAYTKDRSGGWAWVAVDAFDGLTSDSGSATDTTISQMELLAPTMGLYDLYGAFGPCEVLVYSDSEYVVLGMNNKSRKRNKNVDYWDGLEETVALHSHVEFQHVKGHADSEYNNLADKLAGEARRKVST